MAINTSVYQQIRTELSAKSVTLVAVSKTKPASDIQALYDAGQRDFGENYVQELTEKQAQLPADIQWHFIGHLQSNKVKQIAPFVHLIHGVDSFKLLQEIDKQAAKLNRKIQVLLQVHIAQEETKFGLDAGELAEILQTEKIKQLSHTAIRGLMGMASFTDNQQQLISEFTYINSLFVQYQSQFLESGHQPVLSMGMSSDYQLAAAHGSTMVRIGSLLFGTRS